MTSQVFVNGVTLSDGAGWAQDVDNVVYQFLSGVAGTNTITATGPAGLGAYVAGRKFRFIPAATNTGATTINITGTAALGARNIFAGGAALTGGELIAGRPVEIVDDGTQFVLFAPVVSSSFTSAETAITQAANTTVNHGLGAVPRFVYLVIRCKTAEIGYSIGDEVSLMYDLNVVGTIYSDATVIGFVQRAIVINIVRKDTFVAAAITNANWKLVFRALR